MDIFVSAITNQDIKEFCFIQFGYNEELFNDVADIIIDCKTEEHISFKLDDDFFRFGHYSNWESVRGKMLSSTLFTKQYCKSKYIFKSSPKGKSNQNKVYINKYGFYFVSQNLQNGIQYQTLDFNMEFIQNLKEDFASLVF